MLARGRYWNDDGHLPKRTERIWYEADVNYKWGYRGNDRICLLLNDEGKLIGLEGNRRIGDDVIVGNFYVCGSNEYRELASLTEAEMEKYKERFWEQEEITQEEIDAACKVEFYSIDFFTVKAAS